MKKQKSIAKGSEKAARRTLERYCRQRQSDATIPYRIPKTVFSNPDKP